MVVAAVLLAGCTQTASSSGPSPRVETVSSPSTSATSSPSSASPSGCPVTLPNGDSPPGQGDLFGYGNGKLWVELYAGGTVRPHEDDLRPNGRIAIKFPWWRGTRGPLSISGRRLGDGASVRAYVPDGYGRRGFQSSAIIFPGPGCYRITGSVRRVSLTFVTKIGKPPGG